ncbi:hypothetical protein DFQ30_000454 [Apophysomyces sp. BC1015]|nr:hypothetical protein DFQ30_000454 [Apophysomyces sp. BC1015]
MKSLHLAEIDTFPFVEPPPGRAVADGYQLLAELGAVDDDNALTPVGRELASLPLDPRVARMIVAAREQQALREVLIIASALSVQDPRDRPLDAQERADHAHRRFADERSEFVSWLRIWAWFDEAIAHKKSNRQLADACRAQFLSHLRLREWRDVHSQLLTVVREHGWRLNESDATFEQIHHALLTGLLGNIGLKADDDPHYLGARGIRCFVWPGSTLAKKAGRWVMAAELVETTRLYARTVARIEPEWIERVGGHLIKRSVCEPHWEKKAAQVVAFERGTLYGLPVYQRRRIAFGGQDPARARELFIRGALVDGEFDTRLPFFAHNRRLVAQIEQLEHKSRRQDVLVDDELIYAYYDALLPARLYTGAAFERWYRDEARRLGSDGDKLLFLSRDDLMRHEAAGVTTDFFPKRLTIAGVDMALSYHFEPGAARDGVTLTVPLYALNQVDARRAEWLVPGMLKEKVQLLLKSLPQKLRRHCVPLPEYVAGFVERARFAQQSLVETLIADIREQRQQMVVDEHGRQLAMARNLAQLRGEFGAQAQQQFQRIASGAVGAALADARQSHGGAAAGGPGAGLTVRSPAGVAVQRPAGMPGLRRAGSSHNGPADNLVQRRAEGPDQAPPVSTALYENLTTWNFGKLPELLEIQRGGQTLFGYPALVDRGAHCDVEVFDSPADAQRIHRGGLRRLFALQLREPIRYLEKNLPGLREMSMQYMALGTQEELREQLIDAALDRACLPLPLPDDNASFAARRDEGRARLSLLAQEIARLTGQILGEYAALVKKLAQAKGFGAAHADMQQQLGALMTRRFVIDMSYVQLAHFPRYLKGMSLRIDKLRADPARDQRLAAELAPLVQRYQRALSQRGGAADAQLAEFRWLLEELRVSLFAQALRTPMPVSVKRLHKVWESMQR